MLARPPTDLNNRSALLTAWLVISIVGTTLAVPYLLLIDLGVQSAPVLDMDLPYPFLAILMGASAICLVALLRRRRWGLYGLALAALANSLVYWKALGSLVTAGVAVSWFVVYGLLRWRETFSRASSEVRADNHTH